MPRPTQKQKIEMYEGLLHDINSSAAIAMRAEDVQRLIRNICDWSYAHRQGNGELTDKQQRNLINGAFWRLRNRK